MADDYDDRPHHHFTDPDGFPDDDGRYTAICDNDNCDRDHFVVVALDEWRALYERARNNHPTNQQRDPDPARRTDNVGCFVEGYNDPDILAT